MGRITRGIIDKKKIPKTAEALYNGFNSDGLYFALDAMRNIIDFIDELYPSSTSEQKMKMIQTLKLEITMKFCHLAENTAAYALAFKSSYSDSKEELRGIFDKLSGYSIGEIVNFYDTLSKRRIDYFAKFIGYPHFDLQESTTRKILRSSCRTVKSELKEVAKLYKQFRLLYNAYKHGYRVLVGKDQDGLDVFVFIDDKHKQKFSTISDETFKLILSKSRFCSMLTDVMLRVHRARAKHEANGKSGDKVNISIIRRQKDPSPNSQGLTVMFPNRGKRLEMEKQESHTIYSKLMKNKEQQNLGKIVAIDLDAKQIVKMDYDLRKVIAAIKATNSANRIEIRRIGIGKKLSIETY